MNLVPSSKRMARELDSPPIEEVDIGSVLQALADPHRRRVVLELARVPDEERSCASFDLPLAKSTRTYHWRVLREAGLIHQRDGGNGTFLRFRREELDQRFPGLIQTLARLSEDG
jgi:DNA-binding transcriptional ArsR family regulator